MYSNEGYVCDLIEQQMLDNPNKIAVIAGNDKLTYGMLDELSGRLADYLRLIGCGQDSLVGIYMESSIHVVISILAVMKAAGTYVPLDPNYPSEHIMYMILDSGLSIILSKDRYIDSLSRDIDCEGCKLIDLESVLKENCPTGQKTICSSTARKYGKSACLIYTSGTTGRPKGVLTSHANLYHYVQGLTKRLKIKKSDIYLHTASIAFSSSNRQIFVPLCSGSTIVMASKEDKLNPQLFFQLIKSQKVTIIDLVPTYVKNCIKFLKSLEEETREDLLNNEMRMVLSASEALISTIPEEFRRLFGKDIRYVNMYGMTETTGIVSTYEIPINSDEEYHIVPIGKAIGDMSLIILDDELKPVKENGNGILYICGPQVTMGYLNKKDLTDKVYLQNVIEDSKENSILFRTGDICQFNSEGNIEYIGRIDHQIKINGVRIEPKEIELVALQYSGIIEAVVIARELYDVANLVMFFVEKEKESVNIAGLKAFMQNKLPKHMIPSCYVPLEAFPLTPNGKINRAALQKCELHLENEKEIVEPRNQTDREVLEVWKAVFHTNKIGIKHSLFDFGSNSLTTFHILSQLYGKYAINIPIAYAFKHPTVMEWTDYIEEHKDGGKNTDNIKYQRGVL